MRKRTVFAHLAFFIAGALVVFGPIMAYTNTYWRSLLDPELDAVTSASVIIEQPGGNYIVLINTALHTNQENLDDWIAFFSGEEISYIFEDISCSVSSSDPGAQTMGESFQSRLPENQMSLQSENSVLLLSRMEHGLFDIVIMSEEFATTNQAAVVGEIETIQISDST